jgi:transcriptional regulator with XRE-family HTH domain
MHRPKSYSNSLATEVRQRFALTQQELGDYLGITAEQVAHAEAGRHGLSAAPLERLQRLARLPRPPAPEVAPVLPTVLPSPAASPAPALDAAEVAALTKRLRRCRHLATGLRFEQETGALQDATLARRRQALAHLRPALAAAPLPTVPLPIPDELWLKHLEVVTNQAARRRPSAAARTLAALRLRHHEEEIATLAALLELD